MPIQINAATSGSTTLVPTDTVTATLTLPASTGTLLSTANPQSGGVIQVVNATYSTYASCTSSAFVNTGLSATITPKFSTSKILVIVDQQGVSQTGTSNGAALRIARNGSVIKTTGDIMLYTGSTTGIRGVGIPMQVLDSPASTSALTYITQLASWSGATTGVQDSGTAGIAQSSITLMEIAA
jgi:hypothetical protein